MNVIDIPEKKLVSICIPVYKRVEFLKRLLDSILIQSFLDFEVIITDDSPDDTIRQVCEEYKKKISSLHYYKNKQPLGSPANWNEAIQKAKGSWIKIMHDDDWFSSPDSLQLFANEMREDVDLIFSGYSIYNEATTITKDQTIPQNKFKVISSYPYYLFAKNELGPPSVLLFRKTILHPYNPTLKWLVDIEGYTRMLNSYKSRYVAKPLIVMSRNETQVTNSVFRNPDIEVKEALVYYRHFGSKTHERLRTYDAWWRLLRNLSIRSKEQLVLYANNENIPEFLLKQLRLQQRIPVSLLKIGILSKLFMTYSYLLHKQ